MKHIHTDISTWADLASLRNDDLVSAACAARVLRVSRTTLWRLAKRGLLVPLKIGRYRAYRMIDLNGAVWEHGR